MSGRKKKLSAKLKRYNIILIVCLVILMLVLGTLMTLKIFKNNDFYKIESREANIEKSKKGDGADHETIGWVRVQGTNIDYPVYGLLSREFEYPVVSESYTWSLSEDSLFHDTMLVYGHNVMNLGPYPSLHDDSFIRMEELMGFVYYDFAKNNQYIQLSMNGENYLYKIFAVGFLTVNQLEKFPTGDFNEYTRNAYLKYIKDSSIYDYDVTVEEDDKILSVITCSRFFMDGTNYDFIVTGRLVEEGEAIEQYGVYRNKNYEKISEILKGAEDDESEENA